ncbi:MAG TPA: hypothetical protein VFQ43_08925 [Nitrososphaera sp.]|nr:hypothetical protein [Nitrososphaera sp.]
MVALLAKVEPDTAQKPPSRQPRGCGSGSLVEGQSECTNQRINGMIALRSIVQVRDLEAALTGKEWLAGNRSVRQMLETLEQVGGKSGERA